MSGPQAIKDPEQADRPLPGFLCLAIASLAKGGESSINGLLDKLSKEDIQTLRDHLNDIVWPNRHEDQIPVCNHLDAVDTGQLQRLSAAILHDLMHLDYDVPALHIALSGLGSDRAENICDAVDDYIEAARNVTTTPSP